MSLGAKYYGLLLRLLPREFREGSKGVFSDMGMGGWAFGQVDRDDQVVSLLGEMVSGDRIGRGQRTRTRATCNGRQRGRTAS